MIALCLASPEGQVGKTALSLGIARKLQSDGRKVGYFKPVSVRREGDGDRAAYRDCDLANEVLELGQAASALCPVVIDQKDLGGAGKTAAETVKRVQEAYQEASRDREIMVVEGTAGLRADIPGAALLDAILGAITSSKLLAVLNYRTSGLNPEIEAMPKSLRDKLVGIVFNAVPASKMAEKGKLTPGLTVPVFGFVPQDRMLTGLSVRDLAESLGAREVTPGNGSTELVENIMAGASVLDHGPLYYGRKTNKAVVVRGERPDMQLAALETPTRVLVLTGGVDPIAQVFKQARRRKVPIVVTQDDTLTALSRLTVAVQSAAFAGQRKLSRMDELLAQNFDFKSLYKALGI